METSETVIRQCHPEDGDIICLRNNFEDVQLGCSYCVTLLTQSSPGQEHMICHKDCSGSEPKSTTEIPGS
jgi:hypothetical protein